MTRSIRVGPLTVRPFVRNGVKTGKRIVDIPISVGGRRVRKVVDCRKKALALATALNRRIEGATGRLAGAPSGLAFGEAVRLWQIDEQLRVETLKKRASSLESDLYRLRSLSRFFGDCDVASIDERRMAAYQLWRLRQGRAARTINTDIGTLSLVLKWAVKNGYLAAVAKVERIPQRPTHPVIPTPEEVIRIIDAAPRRLRLLLRFIAETGCRKGEAVNLTWDCVDEINGVVEIRHRGEWTPKTESSERTIPLSGGLLAALRGVRKRGRLVFAGRDPKRPIDNFRKALASACLRAGLKRGGRPAVVTVHGLRKAFATLHAMRGTPQAVLQALLGHAPGSRMTNQYYVRATEEAKRAAVVELPFVRVANASGTK